MVTLYTTDRTWHVNRFPIFFVFLERYSGYLGTEPTPSFLPSMKICHGIFSFGYVFSLMIDLRGGETRCKRNKLVLSLTVTALLTVYHWRVITVCSEDFSSFCLLCMTKISFSTASTHPWLQEQCPKWTYVFEKRFWAVFMQFSWKVAQMYFVVEIWAWYSARWRPGDSFRFGKRRPEYWSPIDFMRNPNHILRFCTHSFIIRCGIMRTHTVSVRSTHISMSTMAICTRRHGSSKKITRSAALPSTSHNGEKLHTPPPTVLGDPYSGLTTRPQPPHHRPTTTPPPPPHHPFPTPCAQRWSLFRDALYPSKRRSNARVEPTQAMQPGMAGPFVVYQPNKILLGWRPIITLLSLPLSFSSASYLRPAGGVKHSDSDLVETGDLLPKKALRWLERSFLNNSRKFKVVGGGFPTLVGQNVRKTRVFPLRLTKCVI